VGVEVACSELGGAQLIIGCLNGEATVGQSDDGLRS
jgi:hypothetical protein